MKKLLKTFILGAAFTVFAAAPAYAQIGDMGFYGGISEGRKLPKTTEIVIKQNNSKSKKSKSETFNYKELLLIGGVPEEFEGKLTIKESGSITDDENSGTFTVTHSISSDNSEQGVDLKRDIVFDMNWRREGNQIIRNYEIKKWTETMTTSGGEYTLDPGRSYFNISFIEDNTPGVTYSKGNISMAAIYTTEGEGGGDEGNEVKVQSSGTIYGYKSAWSSTETHRINTWVYGDGWQMQYQLRPSVSVTKAMQYSQNEPTAISFPGNYTEIIQNTSVLSYNIYNKPLQYYDLESSGSIYIDSYNSIEQLIAPDVSFLKGHFAEDDIRRLFSMQILEGETRYFIPDQAMTRGEYVEALAKAVKLPIEEPSTKKSSRKNAAVKTVFPDVLPEREEYPYIMAAYNAGLAIGRDSGNFHIDAPIQRQEAIVILIRTLGLENLGLNPSPVTRFVDDGLIGDWARQEINAAVVLGIVYPDSSGKLNPAEYITKAEGAAMVNRLVNYMRQDMVKDYTENIINYAD